MAGQIRKTDSLATQVSKIVRVGGSIGKGLQVPGASLRTAGRESGKDDGAGTDQMGKPGALGLVIVLDWDSAKTLAVKDLIVGSGLVAYDPENGESAVLQSHPLASPVCAMMMR